MENTPDRSSNKISQKVLIIVIWAAFGLALVWLANQYLGITGQITFQTHFQDDSTIIKFDDSSNILSYQGDDGLEHSRIIQDNIRFSLLPPVAYEEVVMSIRFKNIKQDTVLLSPQPKVGLEEVSIPLVVDWLDQLAWEVIDNGTIRLWQRNPEFGSVEDFLKDIPETGVAQAWYQPEAQSIYPENVKSRVPDVSQGKIIKNLSNESLSEFDFIISTYRAPIKDDQWLISEQRFDLKSLFVNDNRFFFSLSAPNHDSLDDSVNLDWLKAKFTKGNIISRLTN